MVSARPRYGEEVPLLRGPPLSGARQPPPEPAPPVRRSPTIGDACRSRRGRAERASCRTGRCGEDEDPTGSERRRQPELNTVGTVEKKAPIDNEFGADLGDDEVDDSARMNRMNRVMQGVARQVSLDPGDGMDL